MSEVRRQAEIEEAQPRRRTRSPFSKLVLAAVGFLGALACLTLFVFAPILRQAGGAVQSKMCVDNLRKLAAAQFLYAGDNNDALPPPRLWMNALKSYVPDDESFACPMVREDDATGYGYSMNEEVALKKLSSLQNPENTPLVFDSSSLLRNATSTLAALPLPGRHRGGNENNVAYADGRVTAVEAIQD